MKKKRYKAVFISPHLDDAVLSCGGTIAKLLSEGDVLILNIFTRYTDSVKKGPIVNDKCRYEEETNAAFHLGFLTDTLNELDAIKSASKIIGYIDNDDITYIPQLSDKIKRYLTNIDYDSLYVPLGIGWHVDHILCHLAMESFFTDPKLLFYEDAPYCLIPNATLYRLSEIGMFSTSQSDISLKRESFLFEWYKTTRCCTNMAIIKNLRPTPYRLAANLVVPLFLLKLMTKRRFLQKRSNHIQLKPDLINIKNYFELKIKTILIYESQFREFFLNLTNCETLYKNYSYRVTGNSSIYERFWHFSNTKIV